MTTHLKLILTFLTLVVFLGGCHIVNIRQPRFARPGEIISVIVEIEPSYTEQPTETRPIFGVKLPSGWSVAGEVSYIGSNSGTLTYDNSLVSGLSTEYGGTWWAGMGPVATWPNTGAYATVFLTLQSPSTAGNYFVDYISGHQYPGDSSFPIWDNNPEGAAIRLTTQKPVRGGAVAAVRDRATLGVGPSRSLQKARDQEMQVVYHYLGWDTLEPEPGQYDWLILDDIVKQARAYDQRVILRVYNPPPWFIDSYGPVATAFAPTNPAQAQAQTVVREFMRLLTLYADGQGYQETIIGYVIWNEPNISDQWDGQTPNPAAYMALLTAAYEGAKAGDSGVSIVSAPLAPTADTPAVAINDLTYLSQLYDLGLADYVDYVGMNGLGFQYDPDHDPGAPAYNFSRLEYLHEVMLAKGDTERKVWALEVGWLCDSQYDLGAFNLFKVAADEQAAYLERAFEKAEAEWPWLEMMVVWNLDFDRYYPPTSNFYWYSVGSCAGRIYLPLVVKN